MSFRKLLLYIHLVVGLAAALVLLTLGLTGAIMVFGKEIDRALNANLMAVRPEGERLPVNVLEQKLQQTHPGTKISTVIFSEEADLADHVTLHSSAGGKNLDMVVNPYTAEELRSPGRANNFVSQLNQFHKNLLLGKSGALITEWGSILLLVLAASGLVLWWPRKIWKLRGGVPGSRVNFDLHNVFGLYSSVFMLIFGVTGVMIHWDNELATLINHLAGAPDMPMPKPAVPLPGATPLSADQALGIALEAVPGAKVTAILGLGTANPVRIIMKYPEDRTPAGRTNLYLDPTTGKILFAQTSRTGPLGLRLVKLWNREIHTGDIFGWPTRILACVASLSLPLLSITGPLIWWLRLRKKQMAA